jgi:hypothetical protein
MSRVPVAHAYNPSYSGGREQEDHGSRSARANNLKSCLESTQHKEGLVEWLKPLSSSSTTTKKRGRMNYSKI